MSVNNLTVDELINRVSRAEKSSPTEDALVRKLIEMQKLLILIRDKAEEGTEL